MPDAAELWRHIKTVLLKLCSCLSTQYRQSLAYVIGFISCKQALLAKTGDIEYKIRVIRAKSTLKAYLYRRDMPANGNGRKDRSCGSKLNSE